MFSIIVFTGTPRTIDCKKMEETLSDVPGVMGTHSIFVWSINSSKTALTGHIVLGKYDRFLKVATFVREYISFAIAWPNDSICSNIGLGNGLLPVIIRLKLACCQLDLGEQNSAKRESKHNSHGSEFENTVYKMVAGQLWWPHLILSRRPPVCPVKYTHGFAWFSCGYILVDSPGSFTHILQGCFPGT